jgi:hypothetical protein
MNQMMSKEEFLRTEVPKKIRRGINLTVIFAYISVYATASIAVLLNPLMNLTLYLYWAWE